MATAAHQLGSSVSSTDRRSPGWWGMVLVIATEAGFFAYLLFGYLALVWAARRVAQPTMAVGDPHVTASLEYAPEFDEGHSI